MGKSLFDSDFNPVHGAGGALPVVKGTTVAFTSRGRRPVQIVTAVIGRFASCDFPSWETIPNFCYWGNKIPLKEMKHGSKVQRRQTDAEVQTLTAASEVHVGSA